ncbi:MAG: hypothetical protein V1873_00105 [Verrucomicrobiota bacterium]
MTRHSLDTPVSLDISGGRALTLYFCFFVSGVAGLIYEVLWAKYLALYVGSTGLAQVIVLATFMGGLALGSQLLGGLADRVGNPLRFYAFLELGIGGYALVFDRMFVVGRDVFIAVVRASGLSAGGLAGGKILACVLSILLPTFLMGGTLPALGRYMARTMAGVGPRISRLYFLNSLGAVFGCLLAGFYLVGEFGLQFSIISGAVLNILVGLVALAVAAQDRKAAAPAPAAEAAEAGEAIPRWATAILLAAVGLSGAVSMMYEVGWIRLLTLVLGSSTYSFSLMLAAFILGLAIGSFLLSLRKRTTGYALIFGLTEAGVGLSVLLMLPLYIKLPYWFNQIASSLSREPATFGLYQFCTFFLCAAVMIVPTILQGVTLPAAIKVLVPDVRRLGRRVGYAYAINTVGTLLGSAGTGFLALPFLGIKGTLELAVGLNTALALAVLATERQPRLRRRGLAVTALAAAAVWAGYAFTMGPWDQQVLSAGVYRTRERIPSFRRLLEEASKSKTLFYRDGVDATIAVQDSAGLFPERKLVINGKVDASTVGDMPTQKTMAYLPLLLHPKPEQVFIVGIGSGATIGSVLAFEGVNRVDVVELSRDVIEASRLFDSVNGRYWEDPRVRVYWEDAKTFLQITDRKYDVIISEPTNPWIAGIAGVFSKEYFGSCRERLAPGGFFVQWIQGYELEDAAFFLILETFSSVFPYYTLWNPTQTDTVLVGSPDPYGPDFGRMEARLRAPGVQRDLESLGIHSLLPFLGFQMADHASKRWDVPWLGVVHSDFFPVLEYLAPRGFFIGGHADAIKWLDRRTQSPANARLWIQDYLKGRHVSRDDYEQCFQFALKYPSLLPAAAVWARQWARDYPGDAEAETAALETSPATYEGPVEQSLAAPSRAHPTWGLVAGKARCRLGMKDYLARRNLLESGAAESLLASVRGVMKQYPNERDPDLFRWRGQLEYDLGLYDAAVTSLRTALNLFRDVPARQDDKIDTGELLCNALLALGDPRRAVAACDEFLAPYSGELKVVLIRSRLEHELPPL